MQIESLNLIDSLLDSLRQMYQSGDPVLMDNAYMALLRAFGTDYAVKEWLETMQ
jgi:hypothetical protein